MKWIVKIVFNELNNTREVHPPYSVEDDVEVPEMIGKITDKIHVEFYQYSNEQFAEEFFQNYEVESSVKLIDANRYGNKITEY